MTFCFLERQKGLEPPCIQLHFSTFVAWRDTGAYYFFLQCVINWELQLGQTNLKFFRRLSLLMPLMWSNINTKFSPFHKSSWLHLKHLYSNKLKSMILFFIAALLVLLFLINISLWSSLLFLWVCFDISLLFLKWLISYCWLRNILFISNFTWR